MKRPKMPMRIRRAVYERDGYACQHCGWSSGCPDGYRGATRVAVQVGTRKKLVYFRPSFTDAPEIRRYREEPVYRYLEVDHIVPLVAGGAFKDMANLQALCSVCNNRKGARI